MWILQGGLTLHDLDDFDWVGTSPITMRKIAGQVSATALAAGTPSANTLYAIPIRAPRRGGVLDVVSIKVAADASAADMRFGVYRATSETNLYPDALLSGSDKIDGRATAGEDSYNPAYSPRPREVLWLAWAWDTAVANAIRGLGLGGVRGLGVIGDTTNSVFCGFASAALADVTTNALPSTFPASAAALTATPIPAIGYHFSV